MPFTCNATHSLIKACTTNDLDFLQAYVQSHGIELILTTIDTTWADNLLHIAQASQSTEAVEFLAMNAPHLITQCNKLGVTPFHLAIEEENQHYCDIYMRSAKANLHCIDLEVRDISSRTLLHYAANKGNLVLTQFFLAQGASAHCYDNLNYTPYDLAYFYPKIAALLNPSVEPSLFSRCALVLFSKDQQWAFNKNIPLEVAAKAAQVFNVNNQNQFEYSQNQERKLLEFSKRH